MAQITFKLPERIVHWPELPEAPPRDPQEMYAKLICHPPLGQPTIVPAGQDSVDFTVLLETDLASRREWQVALWHDLDVQEDQWVSADFADATEAHQIIEVQSSISTKARRTLFRLSLWGRPKFRNSQVNFTIKFKPREAESWRWANQYSIGDGVLYYQDTFEKHDLSHYIEGTSSEIKLETLTAETPDTQLWSLHAPVRASSGDDSGYSSHRLGVPTSFSHWFALVRLWSPWLAPRQGKKKYDSDKDAILASFLRTDGQHLVILAISGIDDVMTLFKHDEDGNVLIHSRNDSENSGTSRILVAVGPTFEIANAAVMYQARKIVMDYAAASGRLEAETEAIKDIEIKPEWFEEWADGFSYCTWNSLGQNLTEEKIYEALDSFKANDIKIANLIIDDNWQSLDNEGQNQIHRGMVKFEANSKGFPSGLWHTVHEIKLRHPSIQHVAVWHAMLGYWGAISPDGQIAKDYKTLKAHGPDWTCVDPEDIVRWYDDFYSFLLRSGVDSVKTDAQFMLDNLESAKDRRRMIRSYQDAWSIMELRKFSGRAISCMSQTPQIIFHSQLPSNKPKLMVRNSDDFFPDVESSHAWHIFCNAHNSLLTQHLNALPDWDMFQTSHPWAGFHAAARCVSGGPIYITDSPGQHDVDLIHQMTARTPRGNTVILRPSRLGRTSQAYAGYEEQKLLKIETYTGAARTGSSLVGVFNINQSSLTEIVTLNDFPGTEEGEYVIRSHVANSISKPTSRAAKDTVITMELGTKGYDILTATPIRHFEIGSAKLAIGTLGLLGKMSGAAGIVGIDVYDRKNGRIALNTSYKALGIIGFYISDLKDRSVENDMMGTMFGRPIPVHCVRKSKELSNVLEIDTAKVWAESDQRTNWSNEVHVELVFLR